MDELYASPRPRVTAAMLPKYIDRCVTMLGTVDPGKISSDGNSFKLFVGNRNVEVVMSTPLNELLDDIVEVTAKVDKQCQLQCIVYRKLNSSIPLNLEEYNLSVEFLHNTHNKSYIYPSV